MASTELQVVSPSPFLNRLTLRTQLSEKFGTDFDKYLIRELIEQIDLKDPNKVSRDKNEAVKSQLLAQELSRMCLKPDFLRYFDEVSSPVGHGPLLLIKCRGGRSRRLSTATSTPNSSQS